jgi:hypothetical protein
MFRVLQCLPTQWLLSLPSKGMYRVEGYCEGHTSIRVPFWGSSRVEGSHDGDIPTRVSCFSDLAALYGLNLSLLLPKIQSFGSIMVIWDHY